MLGPFGDVNSFMNALAELTVEATDFFRDGGTTYVIFRSASGQRFAACFDDQIETDTPGRLYFGNSHAHSGSQKAEIVAFNSSLEDAVIGVLRKHIEGNFSADEIREGEEEHRRFMEAYEKSPENGVSWVEIQAMVTARLRNWHGVEIA